MIIQWLKIGGFGGLSSAELTFRSGVNIVYGENESGKSTAAGFIKGMLFGLERKKGRGSQRDEFSRYEPESVKDEYFGEMGFSAGGKDFRLFKDFRYGKAQSTLFCETDYEVLDISRGDLDALLGDVTPLTFKEAAFVSSDTGSLFGKSVYSFKDDLLTSFEKDYSDDVRTSVKLLKEERKKAESTLFSMEEKRTGKYEDLVREAEYLRNEASKLQTRIKAVPKEEGSRKKALGIPAAFFAAGIAMLIAFILADSRPAACAVASVCFFAAGFFLLLKKIPDLASDKKTLYMLKAELADKKARLSNINEKIKEAGIETAAEKELKIRILGISAAEDLIEQLGNEKKKNTAARLKKRAAEIFTIASGNPEEILYINDDLDYFVVRNGIRIPSWKCSTGTRALVDFSLRMSAWESYGYEEPMPAIFDDAFVFFDDRRLSGLLRFLSEEKQQVIIFTCRSHEEALLKEMGIPFHKSILSYT